MSFAALRGRCAACGARIDYRYLIVEILGAAAAIAAFAAFGATFQAFAALVFLLALAALAAIDLETRYLPDAITLPLILSGLLVNASAQFAPLTSAAIGAAAGYGAFRLIGEVFVRFRRIEGLGQGDAKLLSAIGAWLGWQALAPVVFLGAIFGLFAALVFSRLDAEFTRQTPIPFGPALALAAAVILLAGAAIDPSAKAATAIPVYP